MCIDDDDDDDFSEGDDEEEEEDAAHESYPAALLLPYISKEQRLHRYPITQLPGCHSVFNARVGYTRADPACLNQSTLGFQRPTIKTRFSPGPSSSSSD
ncbi:hypothetical protein ElyMa_001043900 [Elysia marginata]|uniref:Uncharacterized protein n=1 Tax=Elysia marginata TaxID=1093978 RepID=A0AAV4HPE2_9GAST|nr:hypothetical protein ElyMa_001043900 [Elysia marginata]